MMLMALAALALCSLAAGLLQRILPRATGILLFLAVAGIGVWFASYVPAMSAGEMQIDSVAWAPELGVSLSFRLDGLSLTFALLICFIGALVLLYTSSYLEGDRRLGSFYTTLLGFMFSMLGLVLADNVVLLFAFWELTSITSFLLIGFDNTRPEARRSALQALLVTGIGGLVLLAGLILLGVAAGTFELREIMAGSLHDHGWFTPMVVLILLGCFTKSAIFPFHLWLPNAMEAPSPVSALLHSATMVKAGVYLIARLHPTLGGVPLWNDVLIIFGSATMLIAAYLATRQPEFKRILAYSTVSSLGTLVLLIGMNAAEAAAVYLLAHAMFKGCLFLVAGSIAKQTGRKYPEKLGGLLRIMPITAAIAMLGALSMAGVMPLAGFVGKELLIKSGLEHPQWALIITTPVTIAGIFSVMAALMVGLRPFVGAAPDDMQPARDPDWRQLLGPGVLAVGGVVAGLMPLLFAEPLVRGTMSSILGVHFDGAINLNILYLLWPFTTALAFSIIVLVLGYGLYLARSGYWKLTSPRAVMLHFTSDRVYDRLLQSLIRLAEFTTRKIQNGRLRSYVRVTMLTTTAVAAWAYLRANPLAGIDVTISGLDAVIALTIVACCIAILFMRTAMAAIALLGAVGFVMALFYVLYSAPDVAMTQVAIETLIVVIFVLVIYHLPKFSYLTSTVQRGWDVVVASAFGLLMGVLAYTSAVIEVVDPVSESHAARAATEGYGRNIVNVILVDFRALDTLGEIFVLGIAAVGVYTLVRLRARPEPEEAT